MRTLVGRLGAIVLTLTMSLIVSPSSTVAGGGCHVSGPSTEGAATGTATVNIEKCVFGPAILYVTAGTEVTFVNLDPVPHAVTGADWGDTTMLDNGQSVTHRFDEAGIRPFQCYLHPGMVGAIVVESESLSAPAPI